jgi:hypothetical protein
MQVTAASSSAPASSAVTAERRKRTERRHRGLGVLWPRLSLTRRQGGRRTSDQLYPNVDRHSPRLLLVAASIMALCCIDGLLTIELLERGAIEANPFMALLMRAGMGWFSSVKVLLTAIGVVVLVACSSMRLFRRVPGVLALYGLLGAYLLLIAYELWIS